MLNVLKRLKIERKRPKYKFPKNAYLFVSLINIMLSLSMVDQIC